MASTEIAIRLPWCLYCNMNPQTPGLKVCNECDDKHKEKILARSRDKEHTGIFDYDWAPQPGIIIPKKDRTH